MNKKASFVNFPIGNACNLRCKFCYNDSWREDKQYFEDLDTLKKRFFEYKFIGQKAINIIGGEPLIYSHFFDLLDFFKEQKAIVTIVTNGTKLANDGFIEKLKIYKDIIFNINISIHSHSDELEGIITSRKNIFAKKIKAIKELQKNNIKFSLSLVINTYNLPYLREIIEFYNKNFKIGIALQGMLTYRDSSKENMETLPYYSDIIKKLNTLGGVEKGINIIHWIPLCIHSKVKNISYTVRECDREYLYSFKRNGENLLKSHVNKNYIGDKCKKCYAFGKFCFGPGKNYVGKYGYDEFTSLDKEKVIDIIKSSNKLNIYKNRGMFK